MDIYLYMFVMNDCRISKGFLSILQLVLVSTCDGGCILGGHVMLRVFTLKSWPSYSLLLVV